MDRLGRLLLERGWITDQQLAVAIRRQEELGGRVGTCLLEIGAISEPLLLKILAEQHGVPAAGVEDLRDIPPEAYKLLPASHAVRYQAVPFRLHGGQADVAVLDVDNLPLLDELSFIMGRIINVHIGNEARIYEALDRCYGHDRPVRFANLLDRLNRARDQWRPLVAHDHEARPAPAREASSAPEAQGGAPPQESPASPPAAVGPEAEIRPPAAAPFSPEAPTPEPAAPQTSAIELTPEERRALEQAESAARIETARRADPTLAAPTSGIPETSGATAHTAAPAPEARLERAESPDDVARALIDALSERFERVLVFRVRHETVRGWLAAGPGIDTERFSEYEVGFDEPSVFLNFRQGGSFFLGALPPGDPQMRLQSCWTNSKPKACAVFPLRVRDRLVAVVLGDRGERGWRDLALDPIQRLLQKGSMAFEMIIMRRKLRQL